MFIFRQKPLMYGVLASGWTLAAYFAQIVFENIQPILISYQKYVCIYVLSTSFISFGICYYKGPPKNKRSKNLIKWTLQACGLISIFFASEYREATAGVIACSIFLYYFPLGIFGGFRRIWQRKFPPKRKLLSKEEFEEQGRIETERALKELRDFVKSPKCKEQWKMVMNLSQPVRFASFVEGDDHVTQDETINYDNTLHTMELSSDEEDSEDFGDSLVVDENLDPINKSRFKKLQNGNSRHQSFNNRTARVTSSTPNGQLKTRQRNNTRAQNTFEISDDE
jgi:NEMP family